jgi:tRNA-dihydrouridine synthase B
LLIIGSLQVKNPVITAPMAGISTRVYRDILRDYGAGLVWGEMISAQALVYNNRRTFELLGLEGEASPSAVQLSGSKPEVLAEAARIVEEKGADIIDINMGCPAPKVVRNGEGASLLLDLPLAGRIMRAVCDAVTVPVTAKIRLGWSAEQINCLSAAQILQDAGAGAITVHGRTRDQFYHGQSDWSYIAAVKKLVSIPVIGNGDVFSVYDAQNMLEQTGCDAVMIARGMVGNPWLVRDCAAVLQGQALPSPPSRREVLQQALAHLRAQIERDVLLCHRETEDTSKALEEGELAAVRSMRGHLAWYIKGLPNAAAIRCRINQSLKEEQINELFCSWLLQMGVNP